MIQAKATDLSIKTLTDPSLGAEEDAITKPNILLRLWLDNE